MESKIGHIFFRIGLGILFVWGGLEKIFIGYFGGVGLEKMGHSLERIFSFLGEQGNYILAIWVAFSELIAGILILLNFKAFYASLYAGFVLLVALFTVYISNSWMQSMIHIALICSYVGYAFLVRKK